jgi:hypothetical protein
LNGEEPLAGSVNEVRDAPEGFKDWVRDNKGRIEKAEKKGTMPYFLKDNNSYVQSAFRGEDAINDPYSEARKNAALGFNDMQKADAYLRGWTGEIWNTLTDKEKHLLWEYTQASGKFNRPLRGFGSDWLDFKGVGKVAFDNEGADINFPRLMSDAISKSKLRDDMWLRRGTEEEWFNGVFGVKAGKMTNDDLKKLVGAKGVDEAFLSTAATTNTSEGLKGKFNVRIYAPAGTEAIYAEPFSHFGKLDGTGYEWDGISKVNDLRKEFEMLINRGYEYQIISIERKEK